jgi:hypothetical protein
VRLALEHPALTYTALTRLIDLATFDAQPAQKELVRDEVLAILSGHDENQSVQAALLDRLTAAERATLHDRVVSMAEAGRYLADLVLESIDPDHPLVQQRARLARENILSREDPDPSSIGFGGGLLVRQGYLASLLPPEESRGCLEKLLTVASDAREAAANRQDALNGARNLVLAQPEHTRLEVFREAKAFASGDRDGSALDELTGSPHPLSAMKVNLGSASLRGEGLKLAHAAADQPEQFEWVRERAVGLLRSEVASDIHAAAVVINGLPHEIVAAIDAGILAASHHAIVRQVAGLLALRQPERYATTLTPRLRL